MDFQHIYKAFYARIQAYQSKHFEKTKYGKKIASLKNIHKGDKNA